MLDPIIVTIGEPIRQAIHVKHEGTLRLKQLKRVNHNFIRSQHCAQLEDQHRAN